MRPDIDLEFLQNCTNADLRTLCDMEKSEYAVTSLKLNEMPKTN